MQDLHSHIKVSPAISPGAAITGNSTTTGATIDTANYGSLEFVVQSGTVTDGTMTFSMYEGDASNMSDESVVGAADLLGSAPAITSGEDDVTERFGYRGNKRYVRIKGVQSGATSGGYYSAVAVQGHPRVMPVP
jgi:hypothetical protein